MGHNPTWVRTQLGGGEGVANATRDGRERGPNAIGAEREKAGAENSSGGKTESGAGCDIGR